MPFNGDHYQVLAAFAGAASAFGFERMATKLNRRFERNRENKKALVMLERRLNSILSQSNNIAFKLRDFKKQVEDLREPNKIIFPATVSQIPLLMDLTTDLYDVDLINVIYDLEMDIISINHDSAALFGQYNKLEDWMSDDKLKEVNYYKNLQNLAVEKVPVLLAFINLLKKKLIYSSAFVRALMVCSTHRNFRMTKHRVGKSGYKDKMIMTCVGDIEREIAEVHKKSVKEIEEVLKEVSVLK